ncbi:MAG: RIP metalloprotease RseP [Clostridium sp.]
MYIVFAVLAFSLLIIVHEVGHFVMAKVNGIKVEEFAIGMGPKAFSIQGKETKYSLGILPIGGYVKMLGEEEDVEDNRSFSSKSPLRRMSVILAGAIMNFALALVIFTFILSKNGYLIPQVGEVEANSPAVEAGLQTGDKFLNIGGDKVFSADDVSVAMTMSKGKPLDIVIERGGEVKNVVMTTKENTGKRYSIGIYFAEKNGDLLPQVREVIKDTPAFEAGLKSGDKILSINGKETVSAKDVSNAIGISNGEAVDISIERAGEIQKLKIMPKENSEKVYDIGFAFAKESNPTFFQGVKQSFKQTTTLVAQTFKGLKMMVTGEANLKTDVGGPVTIIKMSGQAAKGGFENLMYFTAFISVNLAVFNLLPFPALDGGMAVIILIELITRKKVPERIVSTINYVGMIILFGFMIFVTIKDILFPIKF